MIYHRPHKYGQPCVRVTVRLSPQMVASLDQAAQERRATRSDEIVRRLVGEAPARSQGGATASSAPATTSCTTTSEEA